MVLVLQHDSLFADPGFSGFSVMAGGSCDALLEMPDDRCLTITLFINKALLVFMAAKKARMVRVAHNQTGKTHVRVDRRILAKKPGLRVSESGHKYDERRSNRSDKSKRRRL